MHDKVLTLNMSAIGVTRCIVAMAVGCVCMSACASCSTSVTEDGGMDAAVVDVRVRDASEATTVVCDASFWDGGTISDWPGYRRLTGFSPCCVFDVATNSAAVPPMAWVPCTNGAPCQEWSKTWLNDAGTNDAGTVGYFFRGPQVSHGSGGVPQQLLVGLGVSAAVGEYGTYDVTSGNTTGGFRFTATQATQCPGGVNVAGTDVAILASAATQGAPILGAQAPTLATMSEFEQLAGSNFLPQLGIIQTETASASRLAFDVQPQGWIVQWPFDAGALIQSTNTTGAALALDFVAGNDVYAFSEYGTSGWWQEYRVSDDGTVMLFRGKDNTQIESMRTDGTTLVWCEAYGTDTPSWKQPTIEVWSAPYTNDPDTLAMTAKKLTTLSGAVWCGSGVMFEGYFATQISATYDTLAVVRVSDGSTQTVSPGLGWQFSELALVSAHEVWSTMDVQVNDAGGHAGGYAFARYPLGAWP